MASIAFTGGGTGGHIYPGLAVVSHLKKLTSPRVFWIGSNAGMDRKIVENAGIEFFGIPSGKLRRYFSLRNILDVFKIAAGFFAAVKILKREGAELLFSKGGFVSVPPCAAAKFLKIPVFTHESDFSPGLATKINTRFAEKIFVPYAQSVSFFPGRAGEKVSVSGNPVRSEFAAADPKKGREFLSLGEDARILLVLGGSLGSQEINALVKACLPEFTKQYTVVHQTGEANAVEENNTEAGAIEQYKPERYKPGLYKPFAYFGDEIPHVIAASEIVLCRSGAGTIWECKYLSKPMVLIPLRGSGTRGDQVENARLFEEAGAAVNFVPEWQINGVSESEGKVAEKLSAIIASLAEDPARRKAMGEARIASRPEVPGHGTMGKEAAEFIAEEINNKLKGKR